MKCLNKLIQLLIFFYIFKNKINQIGLEIAVLRSEKVQTFQKVAAAKAEFENTEKREQLSREKQSK